MQELREGNLITTQEARDRISKALAEVVEAECAHVKAMQKARDDRWEGGFRIIMATFRIRRGARTVRLMVKGFFGH